MIGSYIAEKIDYWRDDLSPELVLQSMELAVENGIRNFKYCERILQGWLSKNIKTISDVEAEQRAFKEKKSKQRTYFGAKNRHSREEIVPEWLHSNMTLLMYLLKRIRQLKSKK